VAANLSVYHNLVTLTQKGFTILNRKKTAMHFLQEKQSLNNSVLALMCRIVSSDKPFLITRINIQLNPISKIAGFSRYRE